ncbi:MAG: hypothetical protein ACM3WS_00980 [Bacillota bacterium]
MERPVQWEATPAAPRLIKIKNDGALQVLHAHTFRIVTTSAATSNLFSVADDDQRSSFLIGTWLEMPGAWRINKIYLARGEMHEIDIP